MTVQRSWSELMRIRAACLVVEQALDAAVAAAAPGVKTKELDRVVRRTIEGAGARPAFLGYRGYPASLCISINDEVIHGIPGERKLKAGDVVSLDVGAILEGYFGDAARTIGVGEVSAEAARLMRVTEEALWAGIEQCHPNKRVGDIGHAVESHVARHGFSTVREFVGHGIGTALHEEPKIPNYGPPGRRERLRPGMCLAIEPMVNAGGYDVRTLEDGWTAVTVDGSLSAHCEYTVAVTDQGPWVLVQPYPYGAQPEMHA